MLKIFTIFFFTNIINRINATIVDSRNPYFAHTPVVYFPYFTILEFIGYLGWIKVAETLLNPWGDDDEDFQINYLIDRNFQVIGNCSRGSKSVNRLDDF